MSAVCPHCVREMYAICFQALSAAVGPGVRGSITSAAGAALPFPCGSCDRGLLEGRQFEYALPFCDSCAGILGGERRLFAYVCQGCRREIAVSDIAPGERRRPSSTRACRGCVEAIFAECRREGREPPAASQFKGRVGPHPFPCAWCDGGPGVSECDRCAPPAPFSCARCGSRVLPPLDPADPALAPVLPVLDPETPAELASSIVQYRGLLALSTVF